MAQQQAPDPRRPDSAVMAPPPIASAPEAAAGAARGSGRQEHMTHRVVARSPPELPTALDGLTPAYAEAFREAPWHETPAQIVASVRGCASTRTSRGFRMVVAIDARHPRDRRVRLRRHRTP